MSKTINQASARATMAPDDVFLVDDGNNTTDAEKAAFSLIGGLVETTGPDADTTMAMGRLYLVDMSGWSSSRTYTLPAEAKAGERLAILVTAGSADHALIVQANGANSPSQTLNGVADGTEWSRLFITNESVAIRCTTANDAFHVEPGGDGRIPCYGNLQLTADQNLASSGAWEQINFDSGDEEDERGDIVDQAIHSNNGGFTLRRAGLYVHKGWIDGGNDLASQGYIGLSLRINDAQDDPTRRATLLNDTLTGATRAPLIDLEHVRAVGDTIGIMGIYGGGADNSMIVRLAVREIL